MTTYHRQMIARDILIPAKMTVDTLAAGIGDYPRVVDKIVTGYWSMLPRVARRIQDVGPALIARGATRIPTYDELMTQRSRESTIALDFASIGEDIPVELRASPITELQHVEFGEMRNFLDWSRAHQAFTLEAFLKAWGKDSYKHKFASDWLIEQGFWPRREGHAVSGRVARKYLSVWRWNPHHYEIKRGRPPVKRPPNTSESPGFPIHEEVSANTGAPDLGSDFDSVQAQVEPYVLAFLADKNNAAFTRVKLFNYMKQWLKTKEIPKLLIQHIVLTNGYATSNNGTVFYKK